MRKPVSKHALRRAFENARAEGLIESSEPTGAVVDHIWHLIEKQAYGVKKRAVARESVRGVPAEPVEV